MLKHIKLLDAAKKGNLFLLQKFKFTYYPHDVNIIDKDGFSPLVFI